MDAMTEIPLPNEALTNSSNDEELWQTDAASEEPPQVESLAEPQVESLAEPQVEPLAEPQVESLAEPQVESLEEPQTAKTEHTKRKMKVGWNFGLKRPSMRYKQRERKDILTVPLQILEMSGIQEATGNKKVKRKLWFLKFRPYVHESSLVKYFRLSQQRKQPASSTSLSESPSSPEETDVAAKSPTGELTKKHWSLSRLNVMLCKAYKTSTLKTNKVRNEKTSESGSDQPQVDAVVPSAEDTVSSSASVQSITASPVEPEPIENETADDKVIGEQLSCPNEADESIEKTELKKDEQCADVQIGDAAAAEKQSVQIKWHGGDGPYDAEHSSTEV